MARLGFLFPGQGAQYVGMGKQLVETVPVARQVFAEATEVLGYDLLELCAHGPAEQLNTTVVSQPAIFVTSLAALESLRHSDPGAIEQCQAAAGLSLGEYTALVFAGAMTFRDALKVVQRRGEAMQAAANATPSAMTSVLTLELAKVEELVAAGRSYGTLEVANLLCPGNVAVSGARSAVEALEKLVEAAGGRAARLAVAGAFHTEIMRPADQALATALAEVVVHQPRVPVWSNVDAQPHQDPEEIRRLLVRQVLAPVLWEQSMRNMLAAGCDGFREIGPGRVLAGLLKRVQRKVEVVNVAG